MNSGSLSDAGVEAQSRFFVSVRVDADAREDLVRLWDVRDLPALLWFTPEGGVLARCMEVPKAPADVLGQMKKALDAIRRLQKLERACMGGTVEAKALKSLAEAYYSAQLWDRSAETFDRLLALDRPEFAESAREFRLYIDLMRGKYLEALQAIAAFELDYPQAKDLPKVVYWRGLSLHRMGRATEAMQAWEEVSARFPDDPQAKLAREAVLRAQRKK